MGNTIKTKDFSLPVMMGGLCTPILWVHGLPSSASGTGYPHAFRHTMASMLYYKGVDSVSVSKRLGHAQVSTTANIYAHVMEKADQRNADILADVFLKKA